MQKDHERVLGNLKIVWKFVSRPIKICSLNDIARSILTALILQNVVAFDHVIDDVNLQKSPAHLVDDFGNFQTPDRNTFTNYT